MSEDVLLPVMLMIAALPLVGFWIGVRYQAGRPRQDRELLPSSPADTQETTQRVVQMLEGLQAQLAELAERQDFTERLLARRLPEPEPHTPV